MNIIGESVILRAVEAMDNRMLLSLINDPETEIMLGGSSWPVSESEQLKWFEGQKPRKDVLRCTIAVKEDGDAVGTIILSDINYINGTGHIHIKMSKEKGRGKGYGTEAVQLLTNYAFNEMRLNCICANVLTYNIPSIKLFERCGFKKEGILRARIYKQGKYADLYSFSKLASDK